MIFAAAVVVASFFGVTTTAGAQTPPTGFVTVVHGVRGLVADVYVDGQRVLQAFQPERATQPVEVPAGPHQVEVRASGAAATGPPVLTGTVTIPAGGHVSAVVHLDANGAPVITTFDDNVTQVGPGTSRIVVRQVAATPPVDVLLSAQALASGLANSTQAQLQPAPATYSLTVATTGALRRSSRRRTSRCPRARPRSCTSSAPRLTRRSAGSLSESTACSRPRVPSRRGTAGWLRHETAPCPSCRWPPVPLAPCLPAGCSFTAAARLLRPCRDAPGQVGLPGGRRGERYVVRRDRRRRRRDAARQRAAAGARPAIAARRQRRHRA